MPERLGQLLDACIEGNAWIVSAILDEEVDVDISDDDDVTALQVAAANGHEHLVRLLIMKGAALDKANSSGWTPLLQAARHGHTNIVALLLQNQADVNARTNLGANAMILAARSGHIQTCQLLEDCGIDLNFPTGAIDGSTCEFSPAMVAALHGHDAILRHLLDHGNDVNYQTPTLGMSSLMFAALNGHMTTAQILIERGADPNLTNVNGDTPLEIALARSSREVQNYLDRKTTRKPRTAYQDIKPDIIDATRHGNIQRIHEILEEDIMQRDACSPQDGATPLMFAAMAGRLDIGKLLVEKGCDVNKQDTISGWTALMQATFHGKREMSTYLISVGADVLIAAKNGCTTFDMVTLMENVDTELCRLIASKATRRHLTCTDELTKKSRSTVNISNSSSAVELLRNDGTMSEENRKKGLKVWWNRMSNRFRNLKLGRTFHLNATRMNAEEADTRMRAAPLSLDANFQNSILKTSSVPDVLFVARQAERVDLVENQTNLLTERSSSGGGSTLYTLGMLSTTNSNPLNNETLKRGGSAAPSLFSPPPTYQTNGSRMPPISLKNSVGRHRNNTMSLISEGSLPSLKGVTGRSAAANGQTMRSPLRYVQKPPPRAAVPSAEVSPSASSEASVLSNGMSAARSKVGASSASSSTGTLTAGSGGDSVSCRVTETLKKESKPSSSRSNGGDLLNGTGTEAGRRSTDRNATVQHSYLKPVSLNNSPSSASTLTPPSSTVSKTVAKVTPQPNDFRRKASSSHSSAVPPNEAVPVPDDICTVLQRLSLEHYQPIFEEQEVDMEAFLTLNDRDLMQLGISNEESRHEILATINELNLSKDRERQVYQRALSHFSSASLHLPTSLTCSHSSSHILDFSEWNMEVATIEQH